MTDSLSFIAESHDPANRMMCLLGLVIDCNVPETCVVSICIDELLRLLRQFVDALVIRFCS